MEKKALFFGFIIGIVAATLGAFLFVSIFTEYNLFTDFQVLRYVGILGKIMTLGAILNVVAFFILIKMKREFMARGVVLATIVLTLITLFL